MGNFTRGVVSLLFLFVALINVGLASPGYWYGESWTSENGRYRLTYTDGRILRFEDQHKLLWTVENDCRPVSGAISDNGYHVAYVEQYSLTVLQGTNGRRVRNLQFEELAPHFESLTRVWFGRSQRLYVETCLGRVFEIPPKGQPLLLSTQELKSRACEEFSPRMTLHMALVHDFELPPPLVAKWSLLRAKDPDINKGMASYQFARRRNYAKLLKAQILNSTSSRYFLEDGGEPVSQALRGESASIIELLKSSDWEEFGFAANAAGCFGLEEAVEPLKRSLRSRPKSESEVAELALIRIQGSRVAPYLLERLESQGSETAARFFARVAYPEAIPVLVKALPSFPEQSRELHRQALIFQTRVDLGTEPGPWRDWLEREPGTSRAEVLATLGEPSAPLWFARTEPEKSKLALSKSPRLVALVDFPSGDFSERTRFNLDSFRLRMTSGDASARVLGWNLLDGVEEPSPFPGTDGWFYRDLETDALLHSKDTGVLTCYSEKVEKLDTLCSPRLLEVSPDGRWALINRKILKNLKTQKQYDMDLISKEKPSFTEDSRLLIDAFRAYDLTSEGPLPINNPVGGKIIAAAPGGEKFLCISRDSNLQLTTVDREHFEMIANDVWGNEVAVSSSGTIAYRERRDEAQQKKRYYPWPSSAPTPLHLTNWSGGEVSLPSEVHCDRLHGFSPDGRYLAVSETNVLKILEVATGEVKFSLCISAKAVDLSQDGRYLAVHDGRFVKVWDLESPPVDLVQDQQLVSELWTGLRLQGGAAVPLTPEQYRQRLRRWQQEAGLAWFDSPGGLTRLRIPGIWWYPLTCLALLLTALFVLRRSRSRR